jgi:hypothetical protein
VNKPDRHLLETDPGIAKTKQSRRVIWEGRVPDGAARLIGWLTLERKTGRPGFVSAEGEDGVGLRLGGWGMSLFGKSFVPNVMPAPY